MTSIEKGKKQLENMKKAIEELKKATIDLKGLDTVFSGYAELKK